MICHRAKSIGGEAEYATHDFAAITQSGRASLRLIIESANLQGKHVLLPNYLCEVIIDVFNEYQTSVEFYPVTEQLMPDFSQLPKVFDVLYIINYFGIDLREYGKSLLNDKHTLIIDDVFYPKPRKLDSLIPCYAFNSLRKISALADGSLIIANRPLNLTAIQAAPESPFSQLKYAAKVLKHNVIHNQQANDELDIEQQYLTKFETAEGLLDKQKAIMGMSMPSQVLAVDFFSALAAEKKTRLSNYQVITEELASMLLPIETDFYSFAIITHSNKGALKRYLAKEKIYLPTHWPCAIWLNDIGENWLSIPLDSRYDVADMKRLAKAINDFS